MSWLKGLLAELKNSREEILARGWRFALYQTYNIVFDNIVYMWVMYRFKSIGWLVVSTISLIQCSILFFAYDRGKVDWLFADAAKKWAEGTNENSGRIRKIISKIYNSRSEGMPGIINFILANMYIDPMIVAVHYQENHFQGLRARDWKILFACVFMGNFWWGIRTWLWLALLWVIQYLAALFLTR